MQRYLVSHAGGVTFFDKLRNGFRTILSEIGKVEHITSDLDNKEQDTEYYADAIELFDSTNIIHVRIFVLVF